MKRLHKFLKRRTIQNRLVFTYFISLTIIFIINAFIFTNINRVVSRINRVYASNFQINRLSESADDVQANLTQYLISGSSTDLNNYYVAETAFNDILGNFTIEGADEKITAMIEDINGISMSYLSCCHDAVSAMRGRNVEQYSNDFDASEDLYNYLKGSLYALNGLQLNSNSENYQSMQDALNVMSIFSIVVLTIVVMITLVFTLILTRSLTAPMETLAAEANEISTGNFDVPELPVSGDDEIGVVSTAFNKMVSSIRGYIEKIKTSMEHENEMRERELRMDASLKDAELKYLQAQINPHFLFNTLNAGAQLALMEKADTTYRYLQNVAAFFRIKTNREKQETTLADEIALTDNYIYIINVRFAGKISYEKKY